jgi:integrase/recombinase XerD
MILAGPLLQRYFTDYLIAQRRLSPQTLASYRDTFRLLLQFVQSELKIEPSRLAVDQLDAEIILRFQLSARSFAWRPCMTRSVLEPQLAS